MKTIKNPGIYTTVKLGLLIERMITSGLNPNMLNIIKQSDTSHISVRAIVENMVVRNIVTLNTEGQAKIIQPGSNYKLFIDFCKLWDTVKEEGGNNGKADTEKPVADKESAGITEGAGDTGTTEDSTQDKPEQRTEGNPGSSEIGKDDSLLPKW